MTAFASFSLLSYLLVMLNSVLLTASLWGSLDNRQEIDTTQLLLKLESLAKTDVLPGSYLAVEVQSQDDSFIQRLKPKGTSIGIAPLNRSIINRDGGDSPTEAGCDCIYSLPACSGKVNAPIVDECLPDNGVSLQENSMSGDCTSPRWRHYDCRDVLQNPAAMCKTKQIDCCGVKTVSAYCSL